MIVKKRSPVKLQQKILQYPDLLHRIYELQKQNSLMKNMIVHLRKQLQTSQQSKFKYKQKYKQSKKRIIELQKAVETAVQGVSRSGYRYQDSKNNKNKSQFQLRSIKAHFNPLSDSQPQQKKYLTERQDKNSQARQIAQLQPISVKNSEQNINLATSLKNMQSNIQKLTNFVSSKSIQPILSSNPNINLRVQQIIERMTKMQLRQQQRQNERLQKQKQKMDKKYGSSLKNVEQLARGLSQFKIQSEIFQNNSNLLQN